MAERTVDVLVPVAVDSPYSYRIPADLALSPGVLVAVPFGSRRVIGAVWPSQKEVSAQTKLKPVSAKLDLPPLPQELMQLIDWVADYTLAPRGMVLRMALRFDAELGAARARIGVRFTGAKPPRMTAARGRVMALLSDGLVRPKAEAAKEAGVSPGVVG
ncbi:MAG TPA: primosomal protein N', partial [Xanthobacteraceae bacterium]|nr:primosomal protein N' [Xanthobacteraceae bacterium]